MSLLRGNISLRRFLVVGPVPTVENLLDGLRRNAFRPFEDGLEEERTGWCDWRNLLITPPDENWLSQDRFVVFSLRIDTRKVPGALLRAHVDLRIEKSEKSKESAFLAKKKYNTSIRNEVNSELLLEVLPTPKISELVWDTKGGILLTTVSSNGAQSALTSLFIKSFGCKLQPVTPLVLAERLLPNLSIEQLMLLNPLILTMETA